MPTRDSPLPFLERLIFDGSSRLGWTGNQGPLEGDLQSKQLFRAFRPFFSSLFVGCCSVMRIFVNIIAKFQ